MNSINKLTRENGQYLAVDIHAGKKILVAQKLFALPGLVITIALFSLLASGCKSSDSTQNLAEIRESISKQGSTESTNISAANTNISDASTNISKALTLHEGDVVRISFLGAPSYNTVQTIRRDGRITLQPIGEMSPVGMTPAELEKEIIRLCGPQLVSKEVIVSVESSAFPVFVTGAVMGPGKIMTDRPISVLQSIMQAGGFNYTSANLKTVRVIREENGKIKNYRLNLKEVMQGKKHDSFQLKPADIVYVPAKFTWF